MNRSEIIERRQIAQKHYNTWLEAELAVATSQSYTIGSRSLTRANLAEIREQQKHWRNEIDKMDALLQHKGRNRIYIAVPRDY